MIWRVPSTPHDRAGLHADRAAASLFKGPCIAAAIVLFLVPLPGEGWRKDTAADLQAKIDRESNPVKKAKLMVRLGHLDLRQAAADYDNHQMPQGEKLLVQSTTIMENAWTLLKSTGRNPARKPDGFMQLEIGLREETRSLSELRRRVFYLYRGPVDAALKTLNQMHAQVLVGLFPGAAAPPSQVPQVKKRNMPAYQNPDQGAPQ